METIWPNISDIDILYRLVKEHADRHFPVLRYKQLLSKVEIEGDDVHAEIPHYDKRFGEELSLCGYAVGDEKKDLTKFGLDISRGLNIEVPVPHLVEQGLVTQVADTKDTTVLAGAGDLFYFGGDWYEVLEVSRGGTFGNTDVCLYYLFRGERLRAESSDYALGDSIMR